MAWLAGWKFRKKHEINGSSAGSVTDYQVKIVCHYGSGADGGEDVYLNSNCRADFGDVRFTDSDGSTLLDYWMEEKVDSDHAVFWVKVPSIPTGGTATIYIYYGKSDATYMGDGEDTFLFFDDFESGNLNKWTQDAGDGNITLETTNPIEGSYSARLEQPVNNADHAFMYENVSRDNIAICARVYIDAAVDLGYGGLYARGDGGRGSTISRHPSNTYSAGISYRDDEAVIWKYDSSGQDTKIATASYSVSLDTEYKLEFRLYGSALKLLVNDSEIVSVTDTTYTSGYTGLHISESETIFDLVYIRKYVEPEPSHGAWYAAEAVSEFSESVATSDVIVKSVSITRTESLSLSDVVSALRVKIKELVETIGLSDVMVKFASIVRSETIAVSDVLEKVKTMYREFVETIGLSDRISKLISIVKSETLSLTDILEKRFVILKILSETLGLSDTLARIRIKKTLARIKGVTRILNAIREKPAERELGK